VVNGSAETPSGGLSRLWSGEVGGEWGKGLGVVGGVVGELDGHGLGGALGNGTVELLDRSLRLNALVKADEPNPLRQPCPVSTTKQKIK
jgi:hypothetical protein